jgi:Fe-S-cluster containining protein
MTSVTPCTGCGSCCDPVEFDMRAWKRRPLTRKRLASGDPADDTTWQAWLDAGWTPEHDRRVYIDDWYDAQFINLHWHPLGDGDALCDMFDAERRICTAYEQRPRICRDYPWYRGVQSSPLYSACSYWADLAAAQKLIWLMAGSPTDWHLAGPKVNG